MNKEKMMEILEKQADILSAVLDFCSIENLVSISDELRKVNEKIEKINLELSVGKKESFEKVEDIDSKIKLLEDLIDDRKIAREVGYSTNYKLKIAGEQMILEDILEDYKIKKGEMKMSINQMQERTNNIKEGIDMKQYVLEEFKDKFSEIGIRIELGEHPMLGGIIKEWTQLGVTIIELSEKNEPVNISLSIDNVSLCSGIDFGRESFDLPRYIIGEDLCLQGITGKMNLESVSTEELAKELDKIENAKPTPAVVLSDLSIDELINEIKEIKMTDEEFIENLAKPLSALLIKSYTPYTQIVISTEGTRITEVTRGIPYTSQG